MSPAQFYIALAIAHVATLVFVLVGYIVQNQNLNARVAELRTDMNSRFNDSNARFSAELNATRSELRSLIEKNHSEMLHRFADLDSRLNKLEHR